MIPATFVQTSVSIVPHHESPSICKMRTTKPGRVVIFVLGLRGGQAKRDHHAWTTGANETTCLTCSSCLRQHSQGHGLASWLAISSGSMSGVKTASTRNRCWIEECARPLGGAGVNELLFQGQVIRGVLYQYVRMYVFSLTNDDKLGILEVWNETSPRPWSHGVELFFIICQIALQMTGSTILYFSLIVSKVKIA
jgi:hypothetical protein